MLANLLVEPLEDLLLVEPLEDLPAELEEPSKDQMQVLEWRVVHLPQQVVQVVLPLEASLAEQEASLVVQVVLPLEASLVEQVAYQAVQGASLAEPVASLEEPVASQ